jgi:hypothetical protein
MLAINKGGTGATTQTAALNNLNGLSRSMIDKPNGLLGLNELGYVKGNSIVAPMINGPTSMANDAISIYTITNFDSFTDYQITASGGTVSSISPTGTFKYIGDSTTTGVAQGFTINGKKVDVALSGPTGAYSNPASETSVKFSVVWQDGADGSGADIDIWAFLYKSDHSPYYYSGFPDLNYISYMSDNQLQHGEKSPGIAHTLDDVGDLTAELNLDRRETITASLDTIPTDVGHIVFVGVLYSDRKTAATAPATTTLNDVDGLAFEIEYVLNGITRNFTVNGGDGVANIIAVSSRTTTTNVWDTVKQDKLFTPAVTIGLDGIPYPMPNDTNIKNTLGWT